MPIYSKTIYNLMTSYYKNYYKNELGLKDFEDRIKLRLDEETNFCLHPIETFERISGKSFKNKKVLVVGAGTGGEVINFNNKQSKTYAIEPSDDALKICHLKCQHLKISTSRIKKSFAEELPFEDKFFDFVYCYTVLEHVNDVKKTIKEIIRCSRKGGFVFIQCPNYNQLYEPHYKLPLPMFLPVWFNKIILRIIGRPVEFLDSINKVTPARLEKIFSTLNIKYTEHAPPMSKTSLNFFKPYTFIAFLREIIYRVFNQNTSQIWLLEKKS